MLLWTSSKNNIQSKNAKHTQLSLTKLYSLSSRQRILPLKFLSFIPNFLQAVLTVDQFLPFPQHHFGVPLIFLATTIHNTNCGLSKVSVQSKIKPRDLVLINKIWTQNELSLICNGIHLISNRTNDQDLY
jgi:hypothetical protein